MSKSQDTLNKSSYFPQVIVEGVGIHPWNICSLQLLRNLQKDNATTKESSINNSEKQTNRSEELKVSYNLNDKLDVILNPSTHHKHKQTLPLEHSPDCPFQEWFQKNHALIEFDASTTKPHLNRILLAACIILRDPQTNKVLLTRRPATSVIFPKVWVVPGGHSEPEETPMETALRELREETGLEAVLPTVKPFCVFESAYPIALRNGKPKNHHIIIYHIGDVDRRSLQRKNNSSEYDICSALLPDPSEVSACAWVSPEEIPDIIKTDAKSLKTTDCGIIWNAEESKWHPHTFHLSKLQTIPIAPNSNPPEEHTTIGTLFVLREYLKTFQNKSQ